MDTKNANQNAIKKNDDTDKKADGSKNTNHKSAKNSEKTGNKKDAKK
ncbi:hypothetical protein IRZ71_11530 [Flavobacterium sp. ANB]|nr:MULTISPECIES: hypothetical protein [unclassified Flavobacterium]MBF4516982.1 hypothetical protein [Flavobacterium sp. ANB]MTD69122.1 hypothetical protein [Flavobacterium sp. LC2016-13]